MKARAELLKKLLDAWEMKLSSSQMDEVLLCWESQVHSGLRLPRILDGAHLFLYRTLPFCFYLKILELPLFGRFQKQWIRSLVYLAGGA